MPAIEEVNYDGVKSVFYKIFGPKDMYADPKKEKFGESQKSFAEMTMRMLEKSPEIGPMLMRLYRDHENYDKTGDDEVCDQLTSSMTDLIDNKLTLSPTERELVTDILLSLLRQAERDLRSALSERVSTMNTAPLRMVLNFATDEISVAEPVLKRSNILNDVDLIYIIKSQAEDHWRAIAAREEMSAQLLETLVDTKDYGTAVVLSENQKLRLTNYALNEFTKMAKQSEVLAKPLLMRKEISRDLAMKLYDYVGQELKSYIRGNFNMSAAGIEAEAVDEIVFEMKRSVKGDFLPTGKMIAAAERMQDQGALTIETMIDNLRRGQIGNFIAMFSTYCGLNIQLLEEVLKQENGQGLAVACKAKGIQKPEFVNMYLLTHRMRSNRIVDKDKLYKALRYYEKIDTELALKILNRSRH